MKLITLLYHDVVPEGNFSYSGFSSPTADLYKFEIKDFHNHIDKISLSAKNCPITVWDFLKMNDKQPITKPFLLTFDDGGVSASTLIADKLDEMNWKAHFFITTKFIGNLSFVSKENIIDLRKRGHVIGSHSHSHPTIFSALEYPKLLEEWEYSKKCLEDILGEEVITASIPGGYYSKNVAKAASESGLKALFTSEPIQSTFKIDNCNVIGRYTIFGRLNPETAASISHDDKTTRFGQWFYWNFKKVAKKSTGKFYTIFRNFIMERKVKTDG